MEEKIKFYYLKHDINGLIFKIETALELIKDEIENTEILEICETSLKDLKTLLNLLFTIEKIKDGTYTLRIEEFKIREIPNLPKNLHIKRKKLKVDRKLFQVLLNLLTKIPNLKLIIEDSKAMLILERQFSQIEKFYTDSIILILKVFEIDTEVKFSGSKKENSHS